MSRYIIIIACYLWWGITAHATTYIADHFDTATDVTISDADLIVTESTGNWGYRFTGESSQPLLDADGGHTGGACTFSYASDCASDDGAAQEGCLFVFPNSTYEITYPNSAYVGFWYKQSTALQGTLWADILKMLRFRSIDCIPEYFVSTGQWNMWINGNNNLINCYTDDTSWHYYIFQVRGASTSSGTDGVLRMYKDSTTTPIYENTSVTWGGSTRTIVQWTVMGGNLSDNWCGGAFATTFDDFILATSMDEVTAFLGIDASTTPTITGGCVLQGGAIQ